MDLSVIIAFLSDNGLLLIVGGAAFTVTIAALVVANHMRSITRLLDARLDREYQRVCTETASHPH